MKRFFRIFTFFILNLPFTASHSNPIQIEVGIEEGRLQYDSFVPYHAEPRPRIGLALSGGGARGLAQIGVLKTLEKHGIPVDCITGTSIGALIGGLYASGYTAAEIESLAYRMQWDDIIQNAPPRRQLFLGQKEEKSRSLLQIRFRKLTLDFRPAYTSGQQLTMLLNEMLLNAPFPVTTRFDHLPIPLRIVCTDLLSGNKVVLDRGSLADAIRASIAIPLLFTPVAFGDSLLMDGGLVENLPVSENRSMGADLVIAVNTSSKIRDKNALKAPWEIADQVTTIMQREQVRNQLESADLCIIPNIDGFSNTNFSRISDCIREGEKAAENVIPQIEAAAARYAKTETDTVQWIHSIDFQGLRSIPKEKLCSDLGIQFGRPVSLREIRWIAQRIYQTGYFQTVTAFVDTVLQTLTVQTREFPEIQRIELNGNSLFPDSVLKAIMETVPGQPLNFQKGRRDLKRIVLSYHHAGYGLARIQQVQFDQGILKISLDEGRIQDIVLAGNARTKPFVILRELPFKKNDFFKVSLFKQGLENIYSTGYFEGIRFQVTQDIKGDVLRFTLSEQGFTLLRSGFHYDTERKTQGFLEIAEENLLGYGLEGAVTGLVGSKDLLLSTEIRADRIFKSFTTSRFKASVQDREYPYFENGRQTASYRIKTLDQSISFGQQMRRLGTLSFQLKNEVIRLNSTDGDQTAFKEDLGIRSISIRSEVDTRDRMPFPKSGKYHILEYETGVPFLGSQISYFKLFSSIESHYSITPLFIFHPKIQWGTADLTVPFAKQFHLGGIDTFLGYPEDALLGKRFIVASGEIRLRIPKPAWTEMYLSVRYDFGGIWNRYTNISMDDFKQGIGILFSLNTPVGPFQTGYGRTHTGQGRYYFTAGYRF
jgi:NTE family protein